MPLVQCRIFRLWRLELVAGIDERNAEVGDCDAALDFLVHNKVTKARP